jgi:DNA-binding transcriptional regulator GbsR (MarR family)
MDVSRPSGTEPADHTNASGRRDHLAEARERFISLWGQMASDWGIPRTMAEIHAVLYIVGRPMTADEIMQALAISRGNASMTLRSLVDWGIVSRSHLRGSRKDHYQAEQDVWKLFRTILSKRKSREFDPLLEALQDLRHLTESEADPEADDVRAHNARLDDMLSIIQLVDAITDQIIHQSDESLRFAAQLFAGGASYASPSTDSSPSRTTADSSTPDAHK